MRIAFVTDNYTPYVSGVINYIKANRAYLERHGHETWVFAFGGAHHANGDSRVIVMPGFKILGTGGFYLGGRFTNAARELLGTMDVVHVDDPFASGRLATSICKRQGIPVVYTNHSRVDLYPDYFLRLIPDGSLDRPMRAYLRRFCRLVDCVISPTSSVADVLRGLGIDVPIRVLPNGIDLAPFLGLPRRQAAQQSAEGVTFAYSGRLSIEKNLPLLMAAFGLVARESPESRLLLIGDGPVREDLEDLARKAGVAGRVTFAGMVPYAEMPRNLKACDVWVTASVTEVDPLTTLEAMAAGLPVAGPRAPGIVDLVADGVTGLLADPDDAPSLAHAMLALAGDPQRRLEMGRAGREASREHDIEVAGAELVAIYESLARHHEADTRAAGALVES